MADSSVLRDGRKYTVNSAGIEKLRRLYKVACDGVPSVNGEAVSFAGVPAIGSAHPVYSYLTVDSYDVEDGEGSEKATRMVWVNYSRKNFTVDDPSAVAPQSMQVDEWGWDNGTDERELTTDIDGNCVLNSAGDPFESVPKVSVPAPVFTKSMKFKTRQGGALDFMCKVNSQSVTIGDKTCAAHTLRCTVSEKRLFGDGEWRYRYTVQLAFKSNKVAVNNDTTVTELGWNVAIADAGMREKDPTTGKKTLIRMVDGETGKLCAITTPTLLNGSGQAYSQSASGTPNNPYNLSFKAYEEASFPSWFYSEPTDAEASDD